MTDQFRSALDEYVNAMLGEYPTMGECISAGALARQKVGAMYEELSKAITYEQHRAGRIGTHGPGCWEWGPQHYECALRHAEELRADAERLDWLEKASHIQLGREGDYAQIGTSRGCIDAIRGRK